MARRRSKPQTIHVEVSADKKSYASRTSRAQVVATNGPNSPIWKASSEVEGAGTKLVAAGTALDAAAAKIEAIQSDLETAINNFVTKTNEFDGSYDIYSALAQARATKPQDITGLGLTVLTRNSYALAAPLAINVKYDVLEGLLHVHVKRAPGMSACIVEISQTPNDPASWKRLLGISAVHKLSGYAPGTYWVRAACVRANEMSEFTVPVSVIVT